ncbi:MAG TPA: alpha/beta hydrolase [Anaerolineae bacterium]
MLIAPIVLIVVIGAVLLAGARAKARRKAQYPPPGRMIDVGGYRLHLQCQGEGEPAVVIDAGQGDFSLSWAEILPQVATFARICTYDRAGLGWSDPSPKPRTAEVMVEELRTLLAKAGVPGPYVLVGASTGGMNVRLFAHKYRREVAGLVLVDSAHEDQFSAPMVQQAMQRMSKMMPLMMGGFQLLVRSGLAALKPTLIPDSSGMRQKLPQQDVPIFEAVVAGDAKHLAAAAAELKNLEKSQAQMRAANITSLSDIPLVVLRHGAEQPMMASPEVVKALEETFERLQTEMASLSSNGKLIVAEQSGHAIHLDQPELVVDAIRQVVQAARESHRVATINS